MDGPDTYNYLYGGSWGYAPWDANTWNKFEANAGKKVSIVHWNQKSPWYQDFNYWKSTYDLVQNRGDLNLVDMSTSSVPLRDIANGLYDSSLTTWAQQAAAWGHPFFMRLDSEMNGNWAPYSPGNNGNTAADFINMWRHFHDLANQAGATNITWVWCPNVDRNKDWTPYSQVYPGDAYVDWTCLDGFNRDGSSFSTIFGSSFSSLLQVAPSKPVMLGEIGSIEGGSGKAAWITDTLSTQLPTFFPQIKALVWFNWRFYQNVWYDFEIESSASSQQAFHNAIASSYYAPGGSYGNLPLLTKIKPLS
jgi:beta-mannanase